MHSTVFRFTLSFSSNLLTNICRYFVEEKLGTKFMQFRMQPFEKSYEETNASTPVFFILSPGVDPLKAHFLYL